jgi:transcription initiation factor TFIIB
MFNFINIEYLEQLENLDIFLNEEKKPQQPKEQSKKIFYCKYCKTTNNLIYDYNYSNEVCSECGIIYNKIIDENSEVRYYGITDNKNSDPKRDGPPINPLLPKSSLGTYISSYNNSKYKSLNRIHKWNQMPPDERSLYEVFKKIDILTKNTKINKKISTETKLYYKKLGEKDEKIKGFLTRGNIRKALIAACLFIACKNNKKPLREVEIAKICDINQSDVTKGLKKFSELEKSKNIKINNYNNIHDFINQYSISLNINNNLIKIIHLIYIRAKKINIIKNNNYYSICGGLLYFISTQFELSIKKSNIIDKIKISEVTLNKIYKEFLENKDFLFIGFDKISFLEIKKN